MTNQEPTTIRPAEILKGDFLLDAHGLTVWDALADATTVNRGTPRAGTRVAVELADGGRGYRFWPENSAVEFAIVKDLGIRALQLVVRDTDGVLHRTVEYPAYEG